MDGAYFGTTFPHLFFMTYGAMIPDPPEQKFVPRVFGFRVHASAANGAFNRGRDQSQQHGRNLEERRRLRRQPSEALAESLAAGAGGASSGGGGKNGEDKETGKVLVQIKAEEEWGRSQGAGGVEAEGGETGAGVAEGDKRRGGRRGLKEGERGEKNAGVGEGGRTCRRDATMNGHPSRWVL